MKKLVSKLGLVALALVLVMTLFTGCQQAEEKKELVIFSWADYVPSDIIDEFEEQYGVTVTYNYFTNPDEALQKLASVDGRRVRHRDQLRLHHRHRPQGGSVDGAG